MNKVKFSIVFFLFCASNIFCQSGINYQGVLRDSDSKPLRLFEADLIVKITSVQDTSSIFYHEIHSIRTNEEGYFRVVLGEGDHQGGLLNYIDELNWGDEIYKAFFEVDFGNGSKLIGEQQFWAVPYAFHSITTDQKFFMDDLLDVNYTSIGLQPGQILVWSGTSWVNKFLPDTVSISNSSNFSVSSDTALVAMKVANAWNLGGNIVNDSTNFLGTTDSTPLILKTNDIERMRITSNGEIGVGVKNPLADFHLASNNGFLFEGNHGTGEIPIEGPGTRMMWYPGKSAFRVGRIDSIGVTRTAWDERNIGEYSFAGGLNTTARGKSSFAFGEGGFAYGDCATSFGYISQARGDASFAAGSVCKSEGFASIALGRGAKALDSASIAIGYHVTSSGFASSAFGNFSQAIADNSVAMGRKGFARHNGSFIFADASINSNTFTTAENQFFVKASGGVDIYSSSDLSTGVVLQPGSGSWSTLSDRKRKENFLEVDSKVIIDKIRELDVYEWNYKTQEDSIRHIGPTSQDFFNTFKLGNDDATISTVDIDGVNLAAIKGLLDISQELDKKANEVIQLKNEIIELKKERDSLEERIIKIEKFLTKND